LTDIGLLYAWIMPPGNLRGGKAYKKGKKNPEKKNVKFEPKGEGQDYARITKLLGNRRPCGREASPTRVRCP
jgi:hypothetical protein